MRREKYDDGAAESRRGILTTANMNATGTERSDDSTIEAVLNKLDDIFSLKEDQTTALKAFVERKG